MADDDKGTPKDEPKDEPKDLGDAGKKALDEERKARREAEKQLNAMQNRVKELEDKDKSESEKLAGRVAELEKELGAARGSAMRLEVALDKGLTKAQAKRLVGESAEDLIADADELLTSFKPSEEPKPSLNGGPKEQLRPGTVPTAEGEMTKEQLRKAIADIPR